MIIRYIVGVFEGVVGTMANGAVTLVLWYGGKLVYDNVHGKHTGLTPGVLTCKYCALMS